MPQSIQQNATRMNARTAGAAATLVAGVMIAQAVLSSIITLFGNIGYSVADGTNGVFTRQVTYSPLIAFVQNFSTSVLPIAIGVFLAFWLIVPLTAELRIAKVVLRSFIAAAIASAVSLVFSIVLAVGGAVTSAGSLFGNSFPTPNGTSLFYSLFGAVQSVLYTFLSVTPLVLLVGVLVWLWASKPAPRASGA